MFVVFEIQGFVWTYIWWTHSQLSVYIMVPYLLKLQYANLLSWQPERYSCWKGIPGSRADECAHSCHVPALAVTLVCTFAALSARCATAGVARTHAIRVASSPPGRYPVFPVINGCTPNARTRLKRWWVSEYACARARHGGAHEVLHLALHDGGDANASIWGGCHSWHGTLCGTLIYHITNHSMLYYTL